MGVSVRIQTATVTILWIIAISAESDGRELRPSDHGLEYQESPPSGKTPAETASFFGGESATKGSSPNVALPKATTTSSNDTSWWSNLGDGGGDKHHARRVMLLASVACGITGVALLLVSAILYLVCHRNQRRSSSSPVVVVPPTPQQQSLFRTHTNK